MPIEQHTIATREQWLALRNKDVTASVAGALFGEHEYSTPLKIYMLKTGQIREDSEESPAMQRGRLLEPVALQLLQEIRPTWKMHDNAGKVYYRDPDARLGGTPDSLWTDPEREGFGVVQVKTVEPFMYRRKWLEQNDGEPPMWIAIQALIEASLTGASWAMVAPMRVGYGIEMDLFEIPLHQGLMQAIRDKVQDFWKLVDAGTPPPPDYEKDGELLIRRYANANGEAIDLSHHNRIAELCEDRIKWARRKGQCEKALDYVDAEIIDILGEAPEAIHPDFKITRKPVKRKAFTVEACTFRQLKVAAKKSTTAEGEEE